MPPLIHHEDGFNADEADHLKVERNMYRRIALGAATALVVPSDLLERIAIQYWKQPAAKLYRIPNGIPTALYAARPEDRKSVVSGKSVSVRVDLGCRRIIKTKTNNI